MKSDIVNDYFYNRTFDLVKKHITSGTGLESNIHCPLCRTKNDGLMAASLVDVQNIINLTGGIPGIRGSVNSIRNYNGAIHTNACLMSPNLASKQSFLDRLRDPVPIDHINDYCFIYYSGHGTREGHIALSEGNIVTPEEIFNISRDSDLPFLIIVDMCYAGKFGEKYQKLVKENNWTGTVMCSSRSEEESFEHVLMRDNPVIVPGLLTPNLLFGQGIFSAAFVVALNQLKVIGSNFTFQELINEINRTMSEMRQVINTKITIEKEELPIQTACLFK